MRPSELLLQLLTLAAFLGSYKVLTIQSVDRVKLRVLGAAFLVVLWAALAFWWTDYVVITDICDCTLNKSSPALSIVSIVAGVIVLLDVFKTSFALLGDNA